MDKRSSSPQKLRTINKSLKDTKVCAKNEAKLQGARKLSPLVKNGAIENNGKDMHNLAQKLFPICRSISGEGFRKSLKILDNALCGGGGYY